MSNEWSKSDRIALAGILIAAVSCVAALIVIPELRSFLGLENTARNTTNSNSNSAMASPVVKSDEIGGPNTQANNTNSKVAGLLVMQKVKVSGDIEGSGTQSSQRWSILILDLAMYKNDRSYLKLSICNTGWGEHQLEGLQLWYTPADKDGSVNWQFEGAEVNDPAYGRRKPLLNLKSKECQTVGGWNEESDHPAPLSSPLGIVHISRIGSYGEVSIDLAKAEVEGSIRLMGF